MPALAARFIQIRFAKGCSMLPRPPVCLVAFVCAYSWSTAAAGPPRRVLHDATVVTDDVLVRNAEATVFVNVSGATTLTASAPLAGVEVDLAIAPGDRPPRLPAAAAARHLARARTGAGGDAVLRFRVPALESGAYRLLVTTRSSHGSDTTERAVMLSDELRLHLRTDRGVYRPGQTILWRVTALGAADAHPAAGEEVEVVVRDPRDTAIWRGRRKVPASGMIAGSIPLADDILTGTYRLTASVRGSSETESVSVREFRLPPFEVKIEREQRPVAAGEPLTATVVARYRYGEPVQGEVQVRLMEGCAGCGQGGGGDDDPTRAAGRLDAGGRFTFSLTLPAETASRVVLRALVTDGAAREQAASLDVELGADRDLSVVLVPEGHDLSRGQLHWFTALTTDGRGNLVPARVHVRSGRGRRQSFASTGARRISLRAPDAGTWKLDVSAVSAEGDVSEQSQSLRLGTAPVVRLRQAVISAGEPIVVTGSWPKARVPLLATLLRGDAPIASAPVRVDPRGRLRAELRAPEGAFGLATVRLVELGWHRDTAGQEREGLHLNVYLRPAALDVAIAAETRHHPGQEAALEVAVRDPAGRPVSAALAASVVDERVLALSEPRPDLAEALRSAGDIKDVTTLGLAFADLLRTGAAAPHAARDAAALRAILEALPASVSRPDLTVPAEARWVKESERIERMRTPLFDGLVAATGAIGRRGPDGRWRYREEPWQILARAGWSHNDVTTPWNQPTTWDYALQIDTELAFERMASEVADRRLIELSDALRRRGKARALLLRRGSAGLGELVASGAVARNLAVDPWGSAIRVSLRGGRHHLFQTRVAVDLVSAGPDLAFGTDDDMSAEDVFGTISVGTGWGTIGHGTGSGAGGVYAGRAAGVIVGSETPLLRQRFDETVLWRVGVATGAGGVARLRVPLGDSVTGWKVAVEAVSRTGAVGTAEARLETFLPLHLDAELPGRLALGDRYRIPVVVANHSGQTQTLAVTADLGGALRRRGPAARSHSLELAAGATGVVHVDAVASAAGTGTVRVALSAGGRLVDRVERSIPIDPPGELVRAIHTGDVVNGAARLAFTVPAAGAVAPGSLRGQLRLFRGAADQALDGIDGMLQEPHGCFEQTSSTTYPNLLVLRLLEGEPRMASARARARAMVGRGYQRLLSYEVEGGGFSWFGEKPANQVLTAYGLMEFVDMAAVYPVDPALIERTRAWLLRKQQRDGSWRPDAHWMHDWSQVQGKLAATAFIAWALAESGARGPELQRALAYLRGRSAALARDPYLLALWAAAEGVGGGKRNPALALLARAGEDKPGAGLAFRAGGETLFHARGQSADTQVTALAATALMRAGRAGEARRALDWLWQARSPSQGWGTTQSTVLALRAAALAAPAAPPSEGSLRVRIDGRDAGALDLASPSVPSVALPAWPGPGSHRVTLDGSVPGQLRADLRLTWREQRPAGAHAAGLSVSLDAPVLPVAVGRQAALTATVENLTRDAVAMPTVTLPIPPGFAADPASKAALEKVHGVSRVEDHGDSLVVYLVSLASRAKVDLAYRLDAQAECDVLLRPAVAYAYYTPELRGHSAARRLRAGRAVARPGPRVVSSSSSEEQHRSPAAAVWW
jgi:hypothetical protein